MDTFSSRDAGLQDNTTQGMIDLSTYVDYLEYKTALIIWKISPAFILTLGVFGNISTIFVMRRIKDHNSSQHAILMALAVSDLTLLSTATIHGWTKYGFQVDIRSSSSAMCKVLTYLIYVTGSTSAWLVTCVTVQRTLAVLWPHRMRVMCTVRRTWIVIATLVFIPVALNSHILVGMEIGKGNFCTSIEGPYDDFFRLVFSWMDSCMISLIPTFCLFVCDIILSVTLFKAAVSSSSFTAGGDSSAGTDSRRKTSFRTTIMVLAISSAFLILTTPICVFVIWIGLVHLYMTQDPYGLAVISLFQAVTYQLWYSNSAINFLLYCLTGTKFRREFMNWIRCDAQSSASARPSVHETASEASKGGRHKP